MLVGATPDLLAQPNLQDGFTIEWLDDLNFQTAIGMTFDDDNIMYVWEKGGRVWTVIDGEKSDQPLVDINDEVSNFGDMGLLGFVLDPNYKENGYIYLAYAVDYYHLQFSEEPFYDPTQSLENNATITRCTRYTVDFSNDNLSSDPESRKILIGAKAGEGPAVNHSSHTGCAIDFGDDGSLFFTTGDGASWKGAYYGDGPPFFEAHVLQALEDGIISEEEEVGQLRSQQKESYSGKVLRIHPETGAGLKNNPYYDPENPFSAQSKVWSLGFRNPYRLKVRKGSGTGDMETGFPGVVYVGDVGGGLWEEFNIIRKSGLNYGWPIFEGCDPHFEYVDVRQRNPYAPNPLFGIDGCEEEYFIFDDLLPQANLNPSYPNPCDESQSIPEEFINIHERPDLNLAHITVGLGVYYGAYDEEGNHVNQRITHPDSPIQGIGDMDNLRTQAVVGGDFYHADGFPEEYTDKYYMADYNQGWITKIDYDLNDSIESIELFYQDTFKLVHVETNPNDGCLYIVNYNEGLARICYGNNLKPIVEISSDQNYGAGPLDVQFYGDQSYDPQGENINFAWDFGDGNTSSEPNPKHTFVGTDSPNPESFTTKLTVTDEAGQEESKELLISINNSPPNVDISSIEDGQLYNMTGFTEIPLEANVSDAEHDESELSFEWVWSLHHNTHFHPEPSIYTTSSSVQLEPAGCETEIYFYGVTLTVTDPVGLVGRDEVFLYPDCGSEYVDLLTFTTFLDNEKVECDWTTRFEKDIDRFELQRSRIDKDFSTIATLSANGSNAETTFAYSEIDENPNPGINIYRLKLIAVDGTVTYSNESLIFFARSDEVYIYPNPARESFLVLVGNINGEAKLELFNVNGQLVRKQQLLGTGTTTFEIPLDGIYPGSYFYRIVNGDNSHTGQLMVLGN